MKPTHLLATLVLMVSLSATALEYQSARIKMMSVEDLQVLVSNNLQKIERGEGSSLILLKKSLELVLAQPDQRLAASSIFEQLQNLASSESNFVKVLNQIIIEGFESLDKDSDDQSVLNEQNSYIYVLNHLLAEIRRYKDKEAYAILIKKVRDKRLQISNALASYRLLNSMDRVQNPSDLAQEIIPKKKSWWQVF